jgi:hypothetical protein
MIFTTNSRFAKQTNPQIQFAESPESTFSSRYRRFASTPNQAASPKPTAEVKPVDPKNKPMKWGAPTWFLFHTLAEKVKPEHFQDIRKDLLNLIYTICSNLPCQMCAKHAVQYLNNVNFNNITTKESLRFMLHRFHNEVNRKKNVPEFPVDQLTKKYYGANTINIIHYFMPFFEDRHRNMKMIADDLHRSQVALRLKAWFNKNIDCFEL